ncbi:MAG: precorrin-6y C5,15-methyltransferase (decarboxylating) subunit CbiE [bacterium]
MAMKKHRITIVGCGPGGLDYMTPAAHAAIQQADVLVGAHRLLESFPESPATRIPVGAHVAPVLDQMESHHGKRIAVLVTGDPGLCSLAKPVVGRFGRASCRIIPGISSIQTAFARAGTDWLDARIINAHGGNPPVPAASLAGIPKLAVLAGHPKCRRWLNDIAATLGNRYRIVICENLTLPEERVRTVTPATLKTFRMPSRCIVLWIEKRET